MSKGFKMVGGDAVVNRTIEMVRDDELLRQTVELVIGTNQGEWSYDLFEGIDRSVVLCKNYDEDEIRTTIEEAVRKIDDTLTLTDFSLKVDARRHATISFKLLKSDGEELGVTYTYAD